MAQHRHNAGRVQRQEASAEIGKGKEVDMARLPGQTLFRQDHPHLERADGIPVMPQLHHNASMSAPSIGAA
jgi:hypothetical protein